MKMIATFRAASWCFAAACAVTLAACGQPSPASPGATADGAAPDAGPPTDAVVLQDTGADGAADGQPADSALPDTMAPDAADGDPLDDALPDTMLPDATDGDEQGEVLLDGEQPDVPADLAKADGQDQELPPSDVTTDTSVDLGKLNLCNPCTSDQQCQYALGTLIGGLCLSYGNAGRFCGSACTVDSDCPSGYGCQDGQGTDGSGKECVLLSSECACSVQAISAGATTNCAVSSTFGSCKGERKCLSTGLSACNAATPAAESCDGQDQNCDGKTDEGCDDDADGFCDLTMTVVGAPAVCAKGGGDCNDNAASIAPDVTETCNDLDDDCDGSSDEGCDADQDGWCTTAIAVLGKPTSCPMGAGDCNDLNAAVSPGDAEVCGNELDDNCDNVTDDGIDASGCKPFYIDADQDSVGTAEVQCRCSPAGSFTALSTGDCDDSDAAINGTKQEVCGNSKDDNCNGQTDEAGGSACVSFYSDSDKDGYGIGDAVCLCGADAAHPATKAGDCDDGNATKNPGAAEACNGVDDNCDGVTDGSGAQGCTQFYPDLDGDGFGNSFVGACLCAADAAHPVSVGGDCDDSKAAVSVGGTESCDGLDNNCNGTTDEAGATGCKTAYADGDGDTYGDAANTQCLCAVNEAYPVSKGGDCNDNAGAVSPEGTEACNGQDDNCDGATDEQDAVGCTAWLLDTDRDGYGVKDVSKCFCTAALPYDATVSGDCDDTNAAIRPGSKESCNGKDDNCDGVTDNPGATGCTVYYLDADKDGFGSSAVASQCTCSAKGTFTATVGGDCADADADRHPQASETCDGVDNDCDGATDPVGSQGCEVWYADVDQDGYGSATISQCACGAAGNYKTKTSGDCDDNALGVNPGAAEKCNSVDDDCDGLTDVDSPDVSTWYYDSDGDGAGTADFEVLCFADGKYSAAVTGDCNDSNAKVFPGATELCNALDDNCNALTDEQDAADCAMWHADVDGDGYGSAIDKACLCAAAGVHTTLVGGDCNDQTSAIHPGTPEECNGADDDCDGLTDNADAAGCSTLYADADLDTYGNTMDSKCLCGVTGIYAATIGGDCDDSNAAVQPGAVEVCNGLDDDCDTVTDPADVTGCSAFYFDGDADAYGVATDSQCLCAADTASHYSAAASGDCDDAMALAHPGTSEVCGDGIDNNCDGLTDEPEAVGCKDYFADVDADGFGGAVPAKQCLCTASGPLTTTVGGDCNDGDAAVHPGAAETCNGVDDNCNNVTDDDSPDASAWFADGDTDGYGTAASIQACSATGPFTATVGGDCDDTNSGVNPGAKELCNAVDDDCSGAIDDGAEDAKTWYLDGDADTFGAAPNKVQCAAGGGYTASEAGDCDDANNAVHPGAAETCNGIDDNCNAVTDDDSPQAVLWYVDADGDSYGGGEPQSKCAASGSFTVTVGGDCDDANLDVHPGATEICNGINDDCAGQADDEDAQGCSQFLKDADHDGYGLWGVTKCLCGSGVGDPAYATTVGGDCDDTLGSVSPGATEACDGIDNNCDAVTDDKGASGCLMYFEDQDADSYGAADSTPQCLCAAKDAFTAAVAGDCADQNSAVHPNAFEACNNIDDNCNSIIDDDSPNASNWYHDQDGDGYGTGEPIVSCQASFFYPASKAGDCNDARPDIHPGAHEYCDTLDNNCDGTTDDDSPEAKDWYVDADSDTYGAGAPLHKCAATGANKVLSNTDCNDAAPLIHPTATEYCNSVDDNCNTETDEEAALGCTFYMIDADLDAYGVFGVSKCLCGPGVGAATYTASVGGDCNDANNQIHPGVTELCDGIDNDCNTFIDTANAADCTQFYVDGDKDGFGTASAAHQCLCAAELPYVVTKTGDCDDADDSIGPAAIEKCNDVDDNCNGITDSDSPDAKSWYLDNDGDGYGAGAPILSCASVGFYSSPTGTDCDDTAYTIHPGATEKCNFGDDNCNGVADDGLPMLDYHPDADSDGFGSSAVTLTLCAPKFGLLFDASDCDDANGSIHPNVTEQCNGSDDDCNGATDDALASAMCSAVLNGGPACIAGACAAACNVNWYDIDKDLANGCECSADSHFGIDGDTAATAIDLGTVADLGGIANADGSIMPGETGDWYTVFAEDLPDQDGSCDSFQFVAQLLPGTGAGFAIDVYRGGHDTDSLFCSDAKESTWTAKFSGPAFGTDVGAGVVGGYVTCPANHVCTPYLTPNPSQAGECNCVNLPTGSAVIADAQVNHCIDDSAIFYVRVYRTAPAANCAGSQYHLQITNGL